jgi:hypothetical protein
MPADFIMQLFYRKIFIISFLLMGLMFGGCRRQTGTIELPVQPPLILPTEPALPTVVLDSAATRQIPARFFGKIISQGSDSLIRSGFCFSASKTTPTVADSIVSAAIKPDKFPFAYDLTANRLRPAVRYYLRAFAENKQGVAYNEDVLQFVVPDNRTVPALTTDAVDNISNTSAGVRATITTDGQSAVTVYGICYSGINPNPELTDSVAITGTNLTQALPYIYTQALAGLAPGKEYFVRAFAGNSLGTAYSNARTFRTTAATNQAPSVQTDNVLNITINTASVDATLTAPGTATVNRYGIVFSATNTTPTLADGVVQSGTTAGGSFPQSFSGNLTSLAANTTYYARAFATNPVGTSYGVVRTFQTLNVAATPPAVVTNEVLSTSITTSSATASGTLTAQGTDNIVQYGFCYSATNANPTTADPVITSGTTSPGGFPFSFNGGLTGLSAGTAYFIRAFARSNAGTSYGVIKNFRTVAATVTPPGVQTVSSTNIQAFSATGLGSLTSSGTAPITEYGIVFSSTTIDPTLADSKAVAGTSSPGGFPFSFSASLTGLVANTTYNFRAYAISVAGTSYGVTQRFNTPVAIPSVTTDRATFSEPASQVTVQGTIQSRGASAINRYGFCYSLTNSNPTLADNPTDIGTAVTAAFPFTFTGNLLRLPAGTYYVRAYTGNASGLAYGNVLTVKVFTSPAITTDRATDKDAANGIETLFGIINSGGSDPVLEYGFCYVATASAGTNFQVGDRGVGVARRTSPLPGRYPFSYNIDVTVNYNTDYSYRAFVRTANGYVYGSIKAFYISYKP